MEKIVYQVSSDGTPCTMTYDEVRALKNMLDTLRIVMYGSNDGESNFHEEIVSLARQIAKFDNTKPHASTNRLVQLSLKLWDISPYTFREVERLNNE